MGGEAFTCFFGYGPLFEMPQKIAKIQCFYDVLNFNLIPNYFSRIIFQLRIYNYLSHSTTNQFFPFHLCPIGISLTYSVQIFCGVMFPANQKLFHVTSMFAIEQCRVGSHNIAFKSMWYLGLGQ